jgi:WD40 repeat protein/tRNA A-37 threonylcarbamoyl transferase component Bud32
MTGQSPAEAIFFAALEKGTPEERAAYLDGACGDDSDLRGRVERLLAAHPQVGSFMEPGGSAASAETATFVPKGEHAGAVIAGRYKLLEQIGEGGMGTVWVAEQLEPIRRRVALKLVKPGMDSRAVLGRFEAERQALALMDHPHIAKVLDAGTTDDQRPYFVMELVKGTPITTFCDARKLSPRERLELFVPVCQAIQHAHTKGIIHRDIKPSNVLVALHDERPVPKVIDFGVAKAVGQQLTEKTLYTGFGALIGTPAYMAPEQATFNQLDIDTRADVYALGVLLYELLAGSPPVEPERLKQAALDEVLRIVREDEPPRPSQRLSTSQTKASIAAVRQSDPAKLTKLMRGEIDWIVMKALEKDRHRRYATADGFAADVQRYLAGEQVQAVPPSVAYRLRKFARKNRAMLTAAAAFALLLIASAAVSGWLAVKARRAERQSEENRKVAVENELWAKENAQRMLESWTAATQARREAERTANSLQVDLDLAEIASEPQVGLLRLCRTNANMMDETVDLIIGDIMDAAAVHTRANQIMQLSAEQTGLTEEERALRESVTAAILVVGQEFAPLLPPITHDGQEIQQSAFAPNGNRLLTRGADNTARVWHPFTRRQIAVLRREAEEVIESGLSPDGTTAFTLSRDGVIRLWETSDGTFRAAIDPRTRPIESTDAGRSTSVEAGFSASTRIRLSNDRVLTFWDGAWEEHESAHPVELWDAKTGRPVARLGLSRIDAHYDFIGDGQWVGSHDPFGRVPSYLVFSADDGRLVARLSHDEKYGAPSRSAMLAPSGHTVATVSQIREDNSTLTFLPGTYYVHFWDTASWHLTGTTGPISGGAALEEPDFLLVADDQVAVSWFYDRTQIFRAAGTTPVAVLPGSANFSYGPLNPRLGDQVVDNSGQIFDSGTWQRLQPPKGRKHHPDLSSFTPDGRFVSILDDRGNVELLDTRTENAIQRGVSGPSFYQAESGWVWSGYRLGCTVDRLPPPDRLDIPPDLLELWAQVAVRGHLDDEGAFVQWDEPTWEQKRQELAAQPAPWTEFPFPGYVATDRLHWLRAEFANATDQVEKAALASELLKRAEDTGDNAEAVRWRSWLAAQAPQGESAPNEEEP